MVKKLIKEKEFLFRIRYCIGSYEKGSLKLV